MDQEHTNATAETGESRVKAKIIKHFVDQVTARWPAFRDEAGRNAYIADAVRDLGPLTVAQLAETIDAVRRDWDSRYRPVVRDFRLAAARLGYFGGEVRQDDARAARAEARRKADGFQKAFMDNWRNPLVREAWEAGFYPEMREYLIAEAVRQFVCGAAQLSIPFPDELVAEWRGLAARRKAFAPMSASLAETVERLRANFANRRAG